MATGPVKGIYGGSTHTLWITLGNFNYDGSTKWTRMIQQLLMQNATSHLLHGRLGSLLPSLQTSVLRQSAASSHSRSSVHSYSSFSTGTEGQHVGAAKRVSGAWLWRSCLFQVLRSLDLVCMAPVLERTVGTRQRPWPWTALVAFCVTLWMSRPSPPGPQPSLVFCPNRQNIPFNGEIGIPAESLVQLVGHKTGMLDFRLISGGLGTDTGFVYTRFQFRQLKLARNYIL